MMPGTKYSMWIRYGVSAFSVAAAIWLRVFLGPIFHHTAIYQTLTIAVVVSVWFGGLGPGLFATGLAAIAAVYFFLPPVDSFVFNLAADGPSLILFITKDLVVCILVHQLYRTSRASKIASEALSESEHRFATAFASAPFGSAIINLADRRFIEVNKRFAEILGYSEQELVGRSFDQFNISASEEEPESVMEIIRRHNRVRDYSIRARKRTGEIILLTIFVEPIELLKVPMHMVTIQDVSDKKRAEEELLISERKYRAIVEGTNAMLFTVDERGYFTYVNDAAAVVLGYPANELLGQFYLRFVHPGDRKWVHQTYLTQLRTGRQFTYMEFRYIPASGREGWLSFSVSPVMRNGAVVGLSGVAQEITKRKQTEESLRASEKKHRLLFETMAQGAIYSSVDGEILDINPAALEILGQTRVDLIGKNSANLDWDMVREDGTPLPLELRAAVVAAREGREVRNLRVGVFNPVKKRYCWIEISSVPQFRDGERLPYQVYSTFSDISAQKDAEDEIRKLNEELEIRVVRRTDQLTALNKELESFSYSISHDLRAPLRAINGFSNILMEEYAPSMNGDAQQLLQMIAKNAKQMGQLIDDLLSFSRLSREAMEKAPIKMKEMVLPIILELRNAEPGRSIELRVDDMPEACGDLSLMRQVWINLISNALKFTRNKTTAVIHVGATQNGSQTVYFIQDNGAGFSMDYKEKLFGVFQRLHSMDEFEGTGIGLALVQRIIQRHGGTIWAEAEPDKGACFYFTLEE